ncbi:MAG TPA: penicillin acylase family protein [Spirochaetota bacterium]|nr:penicillin acylase family protein [Spirochaetota bacterium]HPV42278.1 penicillin acylase family protein [Spirochaetota bacterium]
MKKKIIIACICLASAALLTAAGWMIFTRVGGMSYSGSFAAGVSSRVVLERGENGVPLIQAKTIDDAYFGLGYLHCQDRYDIMEYFRAVAAGDAAGVIGKDGAVIDRLSRSMEFAGKAREMAGRISEPYAGYLSGYVKGVNEARGRLGKKDIVKRPWTMGDVIAVLMLREWAGAFLNNKENLFLFSREETVANLREIIPEDLIFYYSENESDCADVVRKLKKLVKRHIGCFDRGYSFYLPAQKTKEKYPVTAFSFDDELSLYPGWYPVHIHTEDRIIKAVTHAGLPFMFAGNNLDISFCGFTAAIDAQDFVAETIIKTGKTYQYLGPAGWHDFKVIRDRGAAVNATENGPVLNDVLGGARYASTVVTVRSFLFGENYIASLFDIPLSKSVEEAETRTRGVMSLPRVYLFSSDDTAIRAWSGMMPARAKTDDAFRNGPDAAWTGMTDLSAFRDKTDQQMPAGSAFLSDAPGPVRDFALPEEGRYERLQRIINRKKRFTNLDVGNALSDKYSINAGLFLPLFLTILGDNPMASARLTRIYFQNWKCRMKTDFVGPTIFHVLLQKFIHETYRDELKDGISDVMENWQLLVPRFYAMAEENKASFFDDNTTYAVEYRETIFDRSFLGAMRLLNRNVSHDINDWSWGNLHRGHFHIPGSGAQINDLPFPGSSDSLLLGSVGPDLKPVTVTSLSGFFGIEESLLFMNFAYSTDRRSRLYYGAAGPAGTIPFHEVSGKYFITVSPEKK